MQSRFMLTKILKNISNLIFPRVCLACHQMDTEEDSLFCSDCLFHIPLTDDFDSHGVNKVIQSFYGKIPIKEGAALLHFDKAGIVQQMIHQYKYNRKVEIGQKLGKLAAQKAIIGEKFKNIDAITAIPLHPIKQAKRGYNQSEVFAKAFAFEFGKPFVKCLKKIVNTESQTHKTRIERLRNVEGSVEVSNPHFVKNKHVLLVDDVLTTGATLEVSAKALLQAGANFISILVIACAR